MREKFWLDKRQPFLHSLRVTKDGAGRRHIFANATFIRPTQPGFLEFVKGLLSSMSLKILLSSFEDLPDDREISELEKFWAFMSLLLVH